MSCVVEGGHLCAKPGNLRAQGSVLKSTVPSPLPPSAPPPALMIARNSVQPDKNPEPEPQPMPGAPKQATEILQDPSPCKTQVHGKESTRVFDEALSELTSRMVEYLAQICKDIECVRGICRQFDLPSSSGRSSDTCNSLITTPIQYSAGAVSRNTQHHCVCAAKDCLGEPPSSEQHTSETWHKLHDVEFKMPTPPALEQLASNGGCLARDARDDGSRGNSVPKEVYISFPRAMTTKCGRGR